MITPRIVSSPGKQPQSKRRWFAIFGGNSLLVSILLHVFFGVGATYLIVEHFTKKHINFVATEPPAPHTDVEHKVQLAKKNTVDSAPPDLKRITTTDLSPITLPEVPDIPTPDDATPTTMGGVDGVMGAGMGGGGGNGNGSGGGGIPAFGVADGVGLEGTLYDLKQTPDRKPTDIAATGEELTTTNAVGNYLALPAFREWLRVLREYVRAEWDMSILDKYYKAPTKLDAVQFFIPRLSAADAPKAFNAQDTVQPRRWIIHYEGKILPPHSGEFRFIGFADDYLMVRIDNRNVLDACEPDQKLDTAANNQEDIGLGPTYSGAPLYCGKWVQMDSATPMDMQVIIGEGPGGYSCFFLMVQEKGENDAKGDYPVFQLKDVPVPSWDDPTSVPPAYTKKKMVFSLAPNDAP